MKFGRIILQVNIHPFMESDFGYESCFRDGSNDVIL